MSKSITHTYQMLHTYFTSMKHLETIPKPLKVGLKLLPPDSFIEKFALAITLSEMNLLLSHLNNKILLNKKTQVTMNTFMYLFNKSGEGKDKAVSTIFKGLSGGYDVLEEKRLVEAKRKAKELAMDDTGDDENWKEYYQKPRELRQTLSTPEGLIKSGNLIEESNLGSYFMTTSELGSELQSNPNMMENMKLLAMGYDLGQILTKTVKTDELQLDHVENLNINCLMFSSIYTLTKNQNVKEKFINFMITAMARRSYMVHITETPIEPQFNTIAEFDTYYEKADIEFDKYSETLSNYSEKLIKKLPTNSNIDISQETRKIHNRYLKYCKFKSQNSSLNRFQMAQLSIQHNAWKTLKQAGLISLMYGRTEITPEDYFQAKYLTELFLEDTISFQKEIDKEPYELLVDYCTEILTDVTSVQLSKHFLLKNGFMEKSQLTKPKLVEMADMCTEFDANGIYSYVEKTGKIRYTKVSKPVIIQNKKEAKDEIKSNTNNNSIISFIKLDGLSKQDRVTRCANGYKNAQIAFKDLNRLLITDCAFNTMHYKDGIRKLDNLEGEQTAIILDVDDGKLPIKQMHELLLDYNHHIATTSNKANKTKYRIVLQLDKAIKFENGKQWKRFYKSIGDLLDIKVDTNINQAGIFFGYKDSEIYSNSTGVTVAIKPHLIEAYREDLKPETKPLKTTAKRDEWYENRLEEIGYAYNASQGKGSIMLLGAMTEMKKLGFSNSIIKETMEEINNYWETPMGYKRLKLTILNQIGD